MAETKAFMVAYDVSDAADDDYYHIDAALKRFGEVISHHQGSVRWISKVSATATQIRDAVLRAVPGNRITVWVTEAGKDRAFYPKASAAVRR